MVTRDAMPESAPDNSNAPPSITVSGVRQQLWTATPGSEADGEHIWGGAAATQGNDTTSNAQDVPEALRPGATGKPKFGTEDENPWSDAETSTKYSKTGLEHTPTVLRPGGKLETNPFKRKPVPPSPTLLEPSTSVGAPAPPTEAFSNLEVAEPGPGTNPWGPPIDESKLSVASQSIPSAGNQESASDIWRSTSQPQLSAGPSTASPAAVSLPSGRESPGWDEVEPLSSLPSMPPPRSPEEQQFSQDAHIWDDLAALDKGKESTTAMAAATSQDGPHGEWNLIDHEQVPAPATLSRQSTWENFADTDEQKADSTVKAPVPSQSAAVEAAASTSEESRPTLPPRDPDDVPPPQPPRPTNADTANKTETYQIKNINWHDANAAQNPRRSPILVQNANGPCPLVALVNALSLTTPANLTNTVLVETLRSREQISLNLLLEAVFDELMSPRRTQPDAALPDVTELYAFLKGLHTGMNVNPRYIPSPEVAAKHKRNSLTHVHPSERNDAIPGTFEDTRDMKLYATFSVPLIHGWLPPASDPAYDAFRRQASSYDDAQNLMFREEELEYKLSNPGDGLSEQEQQMYQDILTIKSWLSLSATQLTPWGLEVITKAIQPGTFSILFRNDHFSTLYRHPQTMQLFTLVTDAGYYNHDEIAWESLVDVNGERTEFFSGDFRVVGGPQQEANGGVPEAWYEDNESSNARGGEWQTVQGRRARNNSANANPPSSPMSATHEQEDRDLALALQLQEEEDERHRAEQAERRRESQLSEHFIEQQGRARTGPPGMRGSGNRGGTSAAPSTRGGSAIAPARGSSTANRGSPNGGGARAGRPVQQVRPLVPPRATTHRPTNEEEDAPPSYEQASKTTPYVPPAGHPNHPESSPSSASTARRRATQPGNTRVGPSRGPSMSPPDAGPSNPMPMGRGRPMPMAHTNSASVGRDKDCVVM
jgi:ubiquitin carboxyl-terminal hydrolase MINDY-1/2